jgi:hypothetical protein
MRASQPTLHSSSDAEDMVTTERMVLPFSAFTVTGGSVIRVSVTSNKLRRKLEVISVYEERIEVVAIGKCPSRLQ